MASRSSISPTAKLLRGSRLFSLPNPLPRPDISIDIGGGTLISSNSATLPYPTHQAIATTQSSLSRGDWGVKRPLPLKSTTKTSTPVVRFTAIDTIEHITDFESAADHTQNLKKWQQMNIPVMANAPQTTNPSNYKKPTSSFERHTDINDPQDPVLQYSHAVGQMALQTAESINANGSEAEIKMPLIPQGETAARWRVKGPWLPGIQPSEFKSYLETKIGQSDTKRRFNQYLRRHIRDKILTVRRKAALDAGDPIPESGQELEHFERVNPSEIQRAISILRADCLRDPLNSELTRQVIIPFLDLPPMPVRSTSYSSTRAFSDYEIQENTTPKSTHPSAGLSYLRTSSFLENHPVLGPQQHHKPIEARVIEPRQNSIITNFKAKLGVAGVVTVDELEGRKFQRDGGSEKGVQSLDLETPGGRKVWVHPKQASIGPDGRITLGIIRADWEAKKVAEGMLEEKPPTQFGERRSAAVSTEGLLGGLKRSTEKVNGRAQGFDVKGGGDPVDILEAFSRGTPLPTRN